MSQAIKDGCLKLYSIGEKMAIVKHFQIWLAYTEDEYYRKPQLLDTALTEFSASNTDVASDTSSDAVTNVADSGDKVNLRSLSQKFLAAYQALDFEVVKKVLESTAKLIVPLSFGLMTNPSSDTDVETVKSNEELDTINKLITTRLQAGTLKFINSASRL